MPSSEPSGRDEANFDAYKYALDLGERVARMEQEVKDLKEELREFRKDVKEELRKIESEIASLRKARERSNGMMKYTITMLVIILSFVAALLGMGWSPP